MEGDVPYQLKRERMPNPFSSSPPDDIITPSSATIHKSTTPTTAAGPQHQQQPQYQQQQQPQYQQQQQQHAVSLPRHTAITTTPPAISNNGVDNINSNNNNIINNDDIDDDLEMFPEEVTIKLRFSPLQSLVFVVVASIVEFVAAVASCSKQCHSNSGYAISVGVVSVVACAVLVVTNVFVKNDSVTAVLAVMLMLWWTAGAFVTTFLGPFTDIKNGFFASWFALGASISFAYNSVTGLQTALLSLHSKSRGTTIQKRTLIVICAGSAVELTAAIVGCALNQHECSGGGVWGVVSGGVSWVVAVVVLVGGSRVLTPLHIPPAAVASVLAVWWIVSAALLTFGKTFENAGNGYFASWLTCLASVFWAYSELTEF